MKKFFIISFSIIGFLSYSQNYQPLDYYLNGTPTYGVKIRTNIPFTNGIAMPTIMLEGFDFGGGNVIDIKLNWYVYNSEFHSYNASSSGAYAPEIKLANDNGNVSIYINDKKYYNRFTVRVYSYGKSETASMFSGWTAVDEPISGTNIKVVKYNNSFGNNVVINSNGYMGVGTIAPDEKLSVNGNIHTKEVRVDLTGWSDFVFDNDYKLPTLQEVEQHIIEKGHLQDIPSAKEVEENGILLGDMNAKLLQKIEELMLYTIQQEKKLQSQETQIKQQNEINQELLSRLSILEKLLNKN